MNHIITKEQYLSAKTSWKNSPNRSAADHIIYNAIRGFDLKRGFTEITSSNKLNNGAYDWQGFDSARSDASFEFRPPFTWPQDEARSAATYDARMKDLSRKFGFEFTPEIMAKMREVMK